MTPEEFDDAVRALFDDRWAASGVLSDVLVVGVVDPTDEDLVRLHQLSPTAGIVAVNFSRDQLEVFMDAIEEQLTATGELAGFLQMAPDGFSSRIDLLVDRPVPLLEAWAADHLPGRLLVVEQTDPPEQA
jgi:hypothetical protein